MNNLLSLSGIIPILSFAAGPLLAAPVRFHLEAALPSQLRPIGTVDPGGPDGAGLAAGGNVDSVSGAPHDASNRFFLAESTIGYVGPTLEGGTDTRAKLIAAADPLISEGTFYKQSSLPGNWQINFQGVVDVATGEPVSGAQNFHPDVVAKALNYYRAVAAAFPNDVQARIKLINAIRDLITPQSFAGNNAYARATKERIINGDNDAPPTPDSEGNPSAINRELRTLEKAAELYQVGIDAFIDAALSGDTAPAALLNPPPSDLPETDPLAVQLREAQKALCVSYARALNFKAEAILRRFQLSYLQGYATPTISNPFPARSLVTALNEESRELEFQLLPVTALEQFSWFPAAVFSPARSALASLSNIETAMRDGSLTFVSTNLDLNITTNVFGPFYVPFMFEPTEFNAPTSFAGLTGAAKDSADDSDRQDSIAASSIGQLDSTLQALADRLNEVYTSYNSQLGQLCGFKEVVENGITRRVPDLEEALLPPERRPGWDQKSTEDRGELGLQWLEIDAAELVLENAHQSFKKNLADIAQKQETWRKIEGSREKMIQDVIIGTGEKIDQLNKEIIEEREKFAQYQIKQAKKAKKRSLLSSIVSTVAGTLAGAFTGGAQGPDGNNIGFTPAGGVGAAATFVQGIAGAAAAYSQAGRDIKSMSAQADLERKLGEINAKKEELAYLQSAGIQFQQIEEEGYRTEEIINSMLLETKALEIQIEMAELRVDQEYAKLSTMLSRVAFLLQQQASALSLANSNPLNSPDFRIIRDGDVRFAEELFLFAQEQAFLAGRAASYSMVDPGRRNNVAGINSDILKARTGRRLTHLLNRLQGQLIDQVRDLGTRASTKVSVSLRDELIQHNYVVRGADGTVLDELVFAWEAQPPSSPNLTAQQKSNEAWTSFLQAHLVKDVPNAKSVLTIPFRLSLSRWATMKSNVPAEQRLENPLFSNHQIGSRIFFKDGNTDYFGTRIDIVGSGFQGITPSNGTVTAFLTPEGSSYVRTDSYDNDKAGNSILIYQLGINAATATIQCAINGTPGGSQVNPQLHERSPANDRWVLIIDSSESRENSLMLSNPNFSRITDISISFSLSSFTK